MTEVCVEPQILPSPHIASPLLPISGSVSGMSLPPYSSPTPVTQKRSSALEAARTSAVKLATSVLQLVDASARLYYDDGELDNPTLDPAPMLFSTPTQQKSFDEKRQLETLQKTVAAKKCWLKVSELKREKVELERVLTALQSNPSVKVGAQLENRIKSMVRLKESYIDVAVHKAQLSEVELQNAKMIEHEARVVILHAKIACVERLKKEQKKRLSEDARNMKLKSDQTFQQGEESMTTQREKQMFFCDCFQGLSTWYSKCFLQRGWLPYPPEEWFVTESTKLQIWCPLAKSPVDYCDTTSFSKCHSLLWEGGDWLEDKAKLGQLLRDTQIMPQTLVVPAGGDWNGEDIQRDMLCCVPEEDVPKWLNIKNSNMCKFFVKDTSRNFATGINICRDFDEVKKVINDSPKESFVVQQAIEPQMLNHGHRFSIRIYLAVVCWGNSKSSNPFVNSDSIEETEKENSSLHSLSNHTTQNMDINFYTYSHGWVTRPEKPYTETMRESQILTNTDPSTASVHSGPTLATPSLLISPTLKAIAAAETRPPTSLEQCTQEEEYDVLRNISRDRHHPIENWSRRDEFMIKFRHILKQVAMKLKNKITVKDDVKSFELFGADFVIDANEKVWLLEVNRSPRQMEGDIPMLHSLLDIVYQESKTPQDKQTGHYWHVLDTAVPSLPTVEQSSNPDVVINNIKDQEKGNNTLKNTQISLEKQEPEPAVMTPLSLISSATRGSQEVGNIGGERREQFKI